MCLAHLPLVAAPAQDRRGIPFAALYANRDRGNKIVEMAWVEDMSDGTAASRTDVLRASPPMFDSRVLDLLSRVHPVVPVLIFAPAVILLAAWELASASVATTVALFIGGYALWTLFEYWLHRIVFHFEPQDGLGARMHWIIHGVHHDHPNDPLRLVMPPAVSVPLGLVVFGLLYLIFGAGYAPGLGAGFFAGYLAYDMIHYYIHHFRARGRLGRMLRERHMRHHFQDDTCGFGISAPYWDEVFRTSSRGRVESTQPQNPRN
jgi:dihydroceramide fatty acyl 2-hydroxylase